VELPLEVGEHLVGHRRFGPEVPEWQVEVPVETRGGHFAIDADATKAGGGGSIECRDA
jgi:hypothetical protein